MLMHGTKYQQYSSFVLDLGVLKVFITLKSYDWLRVHLVPDSISMVHQSSSNVYDPLLNWITSIGYAIWCLYQNCEEFLKVCIQQNSMSRHVNFHLSRHFSFVHLQFFLTNMSDSTTMNCAIAAYTTNC
jgi:hypothetical protein